jgi:hypothetical protein
MVTLEWQAVSCVVSAFGLVRFPRTRYVFITVDYSLARVKQYAAAGKEPDTKGQQLADELRARFADWYYVISGADFNKLRPSRRDLRG